MSKNKLKIISRRRNGKFSCPFRAENLNCDLSTIVNVTDNGGSSGRLRKLGVLPPGDIRQCLIALSDANDEIKNYSIRALKRQSKSHAFGNIFIASLEKAYGNIEKAIKIASRSLNTRGDTIPIT